MYVHGHHISRSYIISGRILNLASRIPVIDLTPEIENIISCQSFITLFNAGPGLQMELGTNLLLDRSFEFETIFLHLFTHETAIFNTVYAKFKVDLGGKSRFVKLFNFRSSKFNCRLKFFANMGKVCITVANFLTAVSVYKLCFALMSQVPYTSVCLL